MGAGLETTAHYAGKSAEAVFNTAVKHPFATLGALAVAGAGGYYLYSHNRDQAEAAPDAPKAAEEAKAGQE